ncbi:MAG: M1 family metallopeptidase, partial [Pyrinomonadaceae bacterium]
MTLNLFGQMPPLETGVSHELAKWRAANYSDVRYKLNITLEKGAPLMKGDIEIRVKLSDEGAKNDLILDWRTTQFANDKDKPYANVVAVNEKLLLNSKESLYFVRDEHLMVDKSLLKAGENVVKIQFASPIKTSGAAITRYVDKEDGAEYVYSLFVPSDASTAFPVFDQPDLKARFSLKMYVPEGWTVVSNSKLILLAGVQNERKDGTGKILHWFSATQPISTYVFAFAAGDFTEFAQRDTGEVVNLNEIRAKIVKDKITSANEQYWAKIGNVLSNKIYVRKSQAEKFRQHAAEVFRLNREGVKFLESWFDYKFPFPKYDLVLIPEFPFGGMEHAGCTFLREDSIIFPTEPTKNNYISRAIVIFHEAAHQWFGDTVTMKWFDDLWLKEGFAEFMAYKTMEKVMPEYNAWKIFYERNKQLAYLTDSTKGTTPIYQEIPNLSAAKSAYGNIVYRKAPSFLRQAEFYLSEDKFQTAVRAFLKKHEFSNATWQDLVKEFETASKQDLRDWSENWVKESGLSKVTVSTSKITGEQNEKNTLVIFLQDDYWTMNTKALIQLSDGKRREELIKFKRGNRFEKGEGEQIPPSFPSLLLVKSANVEFIFPNYQDYGYGIFLLDEKSRAYVLENIQNEKDDFLRTMMWGSL